jgi:hypothetical protein
VVCRSMQTLTTNSPLSLCPSYPTHTHTCSLTLCGLCSHWLTVVSLASRAVVAAHAVDLLDDLCEESLHKDRPCASRPTALEGG